MRAISRLKSTFESALRRTGRRALVVLQAVWAVPVVLVARCLRPFVLLRVGLLESRRIGHFVADASIFFAAHHGTRRGRTLDIFWLENETANEQWARMVRRELIVRSWARLLYTFNQRIPGGSRHVLGSPSGTGSRAHYAPLRFSSARLEFTAAEEERAHNWLKAYGWRPGEPIACLNVRDSAYLSQHPLHAGRGDWSYHDYRDSTIVSYVEAAELLLRRGYWVIRMGRLVRERAPINHPRFIDYPFVDDSEDLLDIWLSARADVFVSTGTGIDMLAWVYGRPLVYVNALPLSLCATPIPHIWVPKHLRWMHDNRPLTLREHWSNAFGTSKEYDDAGIVIEDLTSSEIAAAVTECVDRLAGRWVETAQDAERQQRYWQVFRSCPDFGRFHDFVHPEARVGAQWLRSMGDAFLE